MRVREHSGFGHGLAPGTDHDISCESCKSERAAGTPPVITGEDDGAATPRTCFYVPVGQFDGNGYIPSVVTEGEPGHAPLTGNGPHASPWYWGKTYEEASATAVRENGRLGISEADAATILLSSIAARSAPRPAPAMIKVEITNAHGTFTTDTLALDLIMARELPASRNELCDRLARATGLPASDYDDISTVTEFLVMLAAADYPWKETP